MLPSLAPHPRAILLALLVTALWSSSWVLIKLGLADLPPLLFAGLRYSLATVCLLPLAARPVPRLALTRLPAAGWARLATLGVLFYAVAQGAQFIGLALLPAAMVGLLLNLTPLAVGLLNWGLRDERPDRWQWVGIGLALFGVGVYFVPVALPPTAATGLAVVVAGVLANAGSAVLGRRINRSGAVPPTAVTTASMAVGAILLLTSGLAAHGLPVLGPREWAIVGWLAVMNTALAFTLWNHTQRTLTAIETSVINGLMLPQIAVLAWLVFGESVSWRGMVGLLLTGVGTVLVQVRGQGSS